MRMPKLAIGATLLFATGCSQAFYHPNHVVYLKSPSVLDDYKEDVELRSADGSKLSAWFFPARQGGYQGTVIQFHGNAQNMTSHFASLFWLTERGYDLLTFDYHGYGASEGTPSQEALNQDALAAIRYVVQTKKRYRVFLWGQSLGGAVVMRAFADLSPDEKLRIKGMIVEGTFYNYHEVARQVLAARWFTWMFQPLAYLLVSNRYGPEDEIPNISPTPLLIIHSTNDPVIPYRNGQRIFELAKEPKQFWEITQGGHIDSMSVDHERYRDKLVVYLQSLQ
jgi:uncharacterized protein